MNRNQPLGKWNEEYKAIQAPAELKKRTKRLLQASRPRRGLNRWVKAAACFALVIGLSAGALNLYPALAASVGEIPGMKQVIRVLTFGRYEVQDGTIYGSVTTPEITGLQDKNLEERINKILREGGEAAIAKVEENLNATWLLPEGTHMGLESGYQVLTDTERYLALDVYTVELVGSSSTTHEYYTVDKEKNELVTLPSLFIEGADFRTPISEYIKAEMIRRVKAGEGDYWVVMEEAEERVDLEIYNNMPADIMFEQIGENQKFYLNEDGALVICFDKYEVGPGATGCPQFVIPDEVLGNIRKR